MTIARMIATDERLSRVTPEAVARGLEGFPLQLKPGFDLTRAIRGALYVGLALASESSSDRKGNAKVRKELFTMAEKLADAWPVLFDRSREADNAIWDYSWRGWQPQGKVDEPPEHKRFTEAVAGVEWLSVFLRRAGMMLDTQGPQWRNAARREEWVCLAHSLSALFVIAYDAEPTVNKWETAKSRGPWQDFFVRVIDFAFGKSVQNLAEVLSEARRRDKARRVSFSPGVLTD